jgi:hypothetical protein
MRKHGLDSGKGFLVCWALVCLAAFVLISCVSQKATVTKPAGQMTFKSPDAAKKALVTAVEKNDVATLEAIFGPDGKDIVSSGDKIADATARKRFIEAATEKANLAPEGEGKVILDLGKEDWPFPIPIVKGDTGWRFDTAAGKEELINRRIGKNELITIEFCRAYVQAQEEYAGKDRNGDGIKEFAQKFRSAEGTHDGLYWKASEGEEQSPLGPLVAEAVQEGYGQNPNPTNEPQPFYGYFYKILTAQGKSAPEGAKSYIVNGHMTGGCALVAYPVHYGSSGVMTFIVNQQGVVFQKDLGEKTAEIVKAMTEYDPDDSWQPVED